MNLNPAINALIPWRRQSEALAERDGGPWNWQQFVDFLNYNGVNYPLNFTQTLVGTSEPIGSSFAGLVEGAYKRNSLVAACLLTRLNHFTEARFMWRRLNNGKPGPLFTNADLLPIQRPWPNGTTASLLSRMTVDADIAGNAFILARGRTVQRLRPDWVEIVLGSDTGREDFIPGDPDQTVAGYMYWPGGKGSGRDGFLYLPEQIAHFAPIPDPTASYRGISILSAALAEIRADQQMSRHREAFFQNGATVNLAVKVAAPTLEDFNKFVEKFRESHEGERQAYKTLFVNQATDIERIGADMQQLEFSITQGAGESRVAAALQVHPVIVGLSEGLKGSALNAGNYQSARRRFADGTCRPFWRDAATSLQSILRLPPGEGVELWYDESGIAFLKEDAKDAADIFLVDAQAYRTLVDGGVDPDTAKASVAAHDIGLVQHTGLLSVQLQEPGTSAASAGTI